MGEAKLTDRIRVHLWQRPETAAEVEDDAETACCTYVHDNVAMAAGDVAFVIVSAEEGERFRRVECFGPGMYACIEANAVEANAELVKRTLREAMNAKRKRCSDGCNACDWGADHRCRKCGGYPDPTLWFNDDGSCDKLEVDQLGEQLAECIDEAKGSATSD